MQHTYHKGMYVCYCYIYISEIYAFINIYICIRRACLPCPCNSSKKVLLKLFFQMSTEATVAAEVAGPCVPYGKDKAHGPTSQQSSTMPGQFLPVRQIRTLLDSILAELNQNYQATLLTGGIDISTVLSPFGLA